jgi:mRNA transport regulator MTR2
LSSFDLQYNNPNSQFVNIEQYATQFAPQLKRDSAIIVNGKPLIPTNGDSKLEFQKKWLAIPVTNHHLNSYDCHLIPGSGLYSININCKVRFDESGKNKLGESADLISGPTKITRPIWGSWYGINVVLIVDQTVAQNQDAEVISSMDYRITYRPADSIISL